jgi:2-keto-4-pentenoate hydratase/2-oxohepta-3-ene-1,7-dioic acid hydratase in catechol pathway
MRYVRFLMQNNDPELGIQVHQNAILPLAKADASLPSHDLLELIDALNGNLPKFTQKDIAAHSSELIPLDRAHLLAPIAHPRHDILCLGVNYASHLVETEQSSMGSNGLSENGAAVYFSKRAIRILGPNEHIKARFDVDPNVDYEVELAVIIGQGGRNISVGDAENHIFGYSVFNDISSRGVQKAHGQWFLGKSLDTYAAMGPAVVTADELRFPLKLSIRSLVNDQERQHSNTGNLIHSVARIIAELSSLITLEAGDIIATGTPAGVGMGFQPTRYLKKGDSITCEIEGIGSLTNII